MLISEKGFSQIFCHISGILSISEINVLCVPLKKTGGFGNHFNGFS